MQENDWRTMYARHRKAAGLTQEKAAELLGVSVRTVANWETGTTIPSDEMVARMCDVFPAPTLAIEHLRAGTRLARDLIPAVTQLPLAQAVAQLLWSLRDFEKKHRDDDLIWISANGQVDTGEVQTFADIEDELEAIVQAAIQLRFAQGIERH